MCLEYVLNAYIKTIKQSRYLGLNLNPKYTKAHKEYIREYIRIILLNVPINKHGKN